MSTTDIKRVLVQLAHVAAQFPDEEPTDNYDGTEIKSAKELAAAMGIPYAEALVRWEQKDLYTGMAAQATTVSVGTVPLSVATIQRARAVALRKRKPRKHRKHGGEE